MLRFLVVGIVFLAAILPSGVHADAPLTREEARDIICQPQYQWNCELFLDKAWEESRYTPWVVNYDCDPKRPYTVLCYGLLQIWDGWASPECLLDPYCNVETAYFIWFNYGPSHWGM